MKTWITDRLPTAADADKNGFVYVEIVHGETALWPWNSLLFQHPRLWHRWLQLNDLPPVPEKPKTQAEKDTEQFTKRFGEPEVFTARKVGSCSTWFTSDVWHFACHYAREDLKRQVRELIKDFPHIGEVQQLRELVKEDAP